MKREDFVFSIGYSGDTAIVDKGARSRYKDLNTAELLEKGLYRAAFCSALFSEQDSDVENVMQVVNKQCGTSINSILQLKRLYGVFSIPENVSKVKAL